MRSLLSKISSPRGRQGGAVVVLLFVVGFVSASAQQARSPKRGVCENNFRYATELEALAPGVSWFYNWGATPPSVWSEDCGISYAPMCWNGAFNETQLRQYLATHPETELLLGFNEPNFSNQANMTPAEAAALWPRLEAIADEFNLKLVAPALNFSSGAIHDGKQYSPYEWLDAFLAAYPEARMDYLALHCYMNYGSALSWFVNDYMYADLKKAENAGKYPHIEAWYEKHGEPQLLLTEFCAWENNGVVTQEFQLNSMVEKVEALELSDRVAGYAWFMAKGSPSNYPYYGMLSKEELTTLGTVYVNMSTFDRTHYYNIGERILAKDYVGSANLHLNLGSDPASDAVIEIREMVDGGYADYLVNVPSSGDYTLRVRIRLADDARLRILLDDQRILQKNLDPTDGWQTMEFTLTLPAGQHTLSLVNMLDTSIGLNWLQLDGATGVEQLTVGNEQLIIDSHAYDLQGRRTEHPHGVSIRVIVDGEGVSHGQKLLRK